MLQTLQHQVQECSHTGPSKVKYIAVIPEELYSLTGTSNDQPLIKGGWGACTKCNCQHFEGYEQACANRACGHAYTDHW